MKILIVDDEKNIRKSLRGILEDEGHSIDDAPDGENALEKLRDNSYHAVFLDVLMPGINGIETLKAIKKDYPDTYVIMMSGHANLEMAVEATRLGAYTFFEKPLQPEKVILEAANINSRRKIEEEVTELRKITGRDEMIGDSDAINNLRKMISKIAPTDSRILITGENGCGKELVARALHYNSLRKDKPFVKINCAAIPKDLIESELFGYEKGAFTGATARKTGRIEEAHTGTLFLDEVGDMSLDTQAKLLRVLEENELVRLGGNKTIPFDVRVISATNHNIPELIDEGDFREDLYYRLRVIPLEVPPLRYRRSDIPLLTHHFARKFSESNNKQVLGFDDGSMQYLSSLEWRGNIRELKNLIERIAILTDSQVVTEQELRMFAPADAQVSDAKQALPEIGDNSLKEVIDSYEEAILRREFETCSGNVSRLAAKLKVDRANLHRKLKNLGIK